jgi:hypothetical protein
MKLAKKTDNQKNQAFEGDVRRPRQVPRNENDELAAFLWIIPLPLIATTDHPTIDKSHGRAAR